MKVTVLGGCGTVGEVAARTVASTGHFDEVVVADYRYDLACELAKAIDRQGVRAADFDASDPESIKEVIEGSQVVVNCVGPFYRHGPTVLKAVIEAGIDYVDVCDDLDATEQMLLLDKGASQAGVSALIGMGNSPGLANVLVSFSAESMLTELESVDIFHIHGGEPDEGPAVIKHRIHAMTTDIPLFIDGEFINVRMLEETGMEHVEEVEFKGVGRYPVYPYPHPETITIPRYFPGIKRVTNKGFVLPPEYFKMIMDAVRLGICTDEKILVGDQKVAALDFAISFILSRRPALLEAAGLTEPMGCLRIQIGGKKDGEDHRYIFSMYSTQAGAGEGTGIPAALGAMLIAEGKIDRKGVFPPEAAIRPTELLELASRVIKGAGMGAKLPMDIEHVLPDGTVEMVDFKI